MKQTNSDLKKYPTRKYSTIGVCGLDCGLCPRYYTVGTSRCPGCCGPDFFNKHPSCSFITCCVKKKDLEVSRSFFCKAAALLDLTDLEDSLKNSKHKLKTNNVKLGDRKNRAKILREILSIKTSRS